MASTPDLATRLAPLYLAPADLQVAILCAGMAQDYDAASCGSDNLLRDAAAAVDAAAAAMAAGPYGKQACDSMLRGMAAPLADGAMADDVCAGAWLLALADKVASC